LHLELELTESVIMRDQEASIPKLEALKELGVRIAIDDFGTGYSSLSYLQRLPVDSLKVDRSFISAINSDPGSLGIVQVVIDLAHARGLTVTAEGVESAEQLEELRSLGCDRAQGYYLAFPAPPRSAGILSPAERA
jgi:EAL domain-containing protein (putative c-di-GMP-specific phosphodiesterase class I)